jgi:hypothetical protein
MKIADQQSKTKITVGHRTFTIFPKTCQIGRIFCPYKKQQSVFIKELRDLVMTMSKKRQNFAMLVTCISIYNKEYIGEDTENAEYMYT